MVTEHPQLKKIVEAFKGAPINVLFVNPSKENRLKKRRKRGKRH